MSTSAIFAYLSAVNAAAEDEILAWHRDVHVPEVREAIPEIVSVTRYRLWSPSADEAPRFLAIYEVDAPDAGVVAAQLGAAAPNFTFSPALNRDPNERPQFGRRIA